MTKEEFLVQLRNGLSGLPSEDVEERLSFYSEMIDDRIEEGLSESEAVDEIGPLNTVVAQTFTDTPLTKLVKERVRPTRVLRDWEIALLILGAPLWLSFLIAALAIALSLYVILWSVIITLWSVEVSLVACSLGGIVSAAIFGFQGNGLTGLAMLGAGVVCAGLSILLFFGCKVATKGSLRLTKKSVFGIKTLFVRKETTQCVKP